MNGNTVECKCVCMCVVTCLCCPLVVTAPKIVVWVGENVLVDLYIHSMVMP